jgi:hypothetical protein
MTPPRAAKASTLSAGRQASRRRDGLVGELRCEDGNISPPPAQSATHGARRCRLSQ